MNIKKPIYFFVLLVLIGSNNLQAQETQTDSTQIKDLYYQALNEKARGDIDLATTTFHKLIQLDEQNDAAFFELARLELEQQNLGDAAIHAKKATILKPDNEWYWILLADVYKQMEDFKSLTPIFDELLRLKPEKKEYYYDRAYALFLNNELEQALQAYSSIEQKFGKDDNILVARQEIYLKQKQPKKAIDELSALIEQEPDSTKGYVLLANLYLKLDKPKEALKVLEDGHKRLPGDPYISLSKADAYHSLKDENRSNEELKLAFASNQMDFEGKMRLLISLMSDPKNKAILPVVNDLANTLTVSYPSDARAFALYGDILAQQKQLKEAREQYLKAIDLNSRVNTIWEQLLQIELTLGLQKDALSHAYKASALFPQQPVTQFFSGHAFFAEKKYTDARNCFEAALNYADERNALLLTQVYSSLGDTYHALDMAAESDQAYEEALSLDSNNVGTLNNYAYYLSLRKANLEEAAKMAKKSNELDPNNPTFQDTYAWVLFQQGHYKEALEWIEKAIANSGETSFALLEHYGDILFKLGDVETAVTKWKEAKATGQVTGENIELLSKKIDAKKYFE